MRRPRVHIPRPQKKHHNWHTGKAGPYTSKAAYPKVHPSGVKYFSKPRKAARRVHVSTPITPGVRNSSRRARVPGDRHHTPLRRSRKWTIGYSPRGGGRGFY